MGIKNLPDHFDCFSGFYRLAFGQRIGTFILFLVLGLGVFGFIFKNVLIEFFVLSK